MKNNKKPLIIISVVILTILVGLLLANFMFKQVDNIIDEEETSQPFYYEEHKNLYV